MESIRQKQIGSVVKRAFSDILREDGVYIYGAEPLITVTSVRMSPDLNLAKIYCSVYNVEDKQVPILQLEAEHARLRQELGRRLKRQVRRIPDFNVYLDDTLDEMYKLNALFDRLHAEKQMGDEEE